MVREGAQLKSISMGSVWDRATEFLGDNIAVVTPVALVLLFVPASITDNIAPLGKTGSPMEGTVDLINLALAIVSILGQLSIIALVLETAESAGDAVRMASGRLFHALLFTILLLLIIMLSLLPVGIAIALSGADMSVLLSNNQAAIGAMIAQLPAGVRWFIFGYVLVWMAGAIWLSARLMLGLPAIVAEQRGLSAFARSFVLTKGLAWRLVGVLLLYVIVSTVAALAAKTAFGGVIRLLVGDDGPMSLASVLTSVAVGAVGTAFAVLQSAFVAKLFVAARYRLQEDSFSQ